MIKTVLVHLNGVETDEVALQTACQIIHPFGGRLDCLRTRLDSAGRVASASSVAMASAIAVAETLSELKRQDVLLTEQAKHNFNNFCTNECLSSGDEANPVARIEAVWVERPGNDVEEIIAYGRIHDLLVLSHKSKNYVGLTPAELGSIVLSAGRPVVIAAPHAPKSPPAKIGIAWKDTPEAARALSAAMPIIEAAKHVVIFSVNEDGEHADACIDCMEGIAESLKRHGPAVELQYLVPGGRHLPETILEAAYDAGIDLLVTGAFGHSRVRQLFFGGFTQRVLDGTNFPVLLFH